jgi:hypothetical protein
MKIKKYPRSRPLPKAPHSQAPEEGEVIMGGSEDDDEEDEDDVEDPMEEEEDEKKKVAPVSAPIASPMALFLSLLAPMEEKTVRSMIAATISKLHDMTPRVQLGDKWTFSILSRSIYIFESQNFVYILVDKNLEMDEFVKYFKGKNQLIAAIRDADADLIPPVKIKTGEGKERDNVFARVPLRKMQQVFKIGELNNEMLYASILLYKRQDQYAVLAASQMRDGYERSVYIDYVGNIVAANKPGNVAKDYYLANKATWPSACTILMYLNFLVFINNGNYRAFLLNAAQKAGCICYYIAAIAAGYKGYMLIPEEHQERGGEFYDLQRNDMSNFIAWDETNDSSCIDADEFFAKRKGAENDDRKKWYYAYFVKT